MMMRPFLLSLALLTLPGHISAQRLITTHYGTGNLSTLDFSKDRTLSISSEVAAGNAPAWISFDSKTSTIYVLDHENNNPTGARTFYVNKDGSLESKNQGDGVTEGDEVHSTLYGGHDQNSFLATAHYQRSKVTTYKLPLNSESVPVQTFKFNTPPGPNPDRQGSSHPHAVHPDPTGTFLVVPDLGGDLIHIFAIDAKTGNLSECAAAKTNPGDGPRHGAFWTSPSTKKGKTTAFFSVNELKNTVTSWNVDYPKSKRGCPSLTAVETLSALPEGVTPPSAAKSGELRVKGNQVYVSNRYDASFGTEQDSISTYQISFVKGQVKMHLTDSTNTHTSCPRTFQISNKGDLVAVGGQTSSNVVILERDVKSGKLGGVVAELFVGIRGTFNVEDGLSSVTWIE